MYTQSASRACPVLSLFNFISKRWTILVLKAIGEGNTRFSDIKRATGNISGRILSERLQELQSHGFILRTIQDQNPLHISYTMTQKGISFRDHIIALDTWSREWQTKEAQEILLEHETRR